MDNPLQRIGVVNLAIDTWTAGTSYTKMILNSFAAALPEHGPELCFLTKKKAGEKPPSVPVKVHHFKRAPHLPGERFARTLFGLPQKSDLYHTAERTKMSVILPLMEIASAPKIPCIGWIPDFQHLHCPEFFTESALKNRERRFREIARHGSLVMLSSESARADFEKFSPEHLGKTRVVPFPSLFAFDPPPDANAESAVRRFHLPEKFALVANQFWKHKNHIAVINAVAELNGKGIHVPVVFTGQISDYRDPQNTNVSNLMQAIAERGLAGQVIVLGRVDYRDLIELMRAAAVAIQPSMSEGWSTSVQDSKALGRPLICSDLAVHREQVPDALGFFAWDRPDQLAGILEEHWGRLAPGPNPEAEAVALGKEREFAREHGQKLIAMCREAVEGFAP